MLRESESIDILFVIYKLTYLHQKPSREIYLKDIFYLPQNCVPTRIFNFITSRADFANSNLHFCKCSNIYEILVGEASVVNQW